MEHDMECVFTGNRVEDGGVGGCMGFVGGFKDKVWTKYLCVNYIFFCLCKKKRTYGSASIDLSLAT